MVRVEPENVGACGLGFAAAHDDRRAPCAVVAGGACRDADIVGGGERSIAFDSHKKRNLDVGRVRLGQLDVQAGHGDVVRRRDEGDVGGTLVVDRHVDAGILRLADADGAEDEIRDGRPGSERLRVRGGGDVDLGVGRIARVVGASGADVEPGGRRVAVHGGVQADRAHRAGLAVERERVRLDDAFAGHDLGDGGVFRPDEKLRVRGYAARNGERRRRGQRRGRALRHRAPHSGVRVGVGRFEVDGLHAHVGLDQVEVAFVAIALGGVRAPHRLVGGVDVGIVHHVGVREIAGVAVLVGKRPRNRNPAALKIVPGIVQRTGARRVGKRERQRDVPGLHDVAEHEVGIVMRPQLGIKEIGDTGIGEVSFHRLRLAKTSAEPQAETGLLGKLLKEFVVCFVARERSRVLEEPRNGVGGI